MKKTVSAWKICDHLKYHIFKRNVQYINMDSVHLVKIKDDCQEKERRLFSEQFYIVHNKIDTGSAKSHC